MSRAGKPSKYELGDMLRSDVTYLASWPPRFDWVGIHVLRGDVLELGPYVGAPTEHTRIPAGVGVCGTAVALARSLRP